MRLPFQRIARADSSTFVCAAGNDLFIIDSSGSVLTQSSGHTALIRLLLVKEELLVSTGDDKLLKFWDLPSLKLRRSVELAKRVTSLHFSADGRFVLVADKFGDVYRYSVEVPESSKAASKAKPLLGHVSLLTSVCATRDGKRIITADRDEHIRVSRYPQSWDVIAYLGGHERFVSALCTVLDDKYLLSAGGDDHLFVWDLQTYELKRKIDIFVLADYSQVPAPRQEAMTKKFKYRQKKRGVDESIAESDEPLTFRNLAVNKIAVLHASEGLFAIVSAAGSSAMLSFPLSALEMDSEVVPQVVDLGQPVLDFDCSSEIVIVSLDRSRLPDTAVAPCCCSVKLNAGSLALDKGAHLLDAAYRDVDETLLPSDETLYGELSYLVKDPAEASGYRDDAKAETKKSRLDNEANGAVER